MTPEQLSVLVEKIKEADHINASSIGIDLGEILNFLLDRYNSKSYYGTIQIKISGVNLSNPREQDVTHKLNSVTPVLHNIQTVKE